MSSTNWLNLYLTTSVHHLPWAALVYLKYTGPSILGLTLSSNLYFPQIILISHLRQGFQTNWTLTLTSPPSACHPQQHHKLIQWFTFLKFFVCPPSVAHHRECCSSVEENMLWSHEAKHELLIILILSLCPWITDYMELWKILVMVKIPLQCHNMFYLWCMYHSFSFFLFFFFTGTEILTGNIRVLFSSVGVCVAFATGYMMLPLFAYFLRNWQSLLLGIALPGLVYLPLWR